LILVVVLTLVQTSQGPSEVWIRLGKSRDFFSGELGGHGDAERKIIARQKFVNRATFCEIGFVADPNRISPVLHRCSPDWVTGDTVGLTRPS
jgi:hypothetical protein